MEKLYGVYGMMEWNAIIGSGKVTFRVPFTGGSMSGYGQTPAVFKTRNEVLMHVIENSHWFRDGKIKLLRIREEEGDGGVVSPSSSGSGAGVGMSGVVNSKGKKR